MGFDPVTVGLVISAVVGAVSTGATVVAGNQARADARHSADLQQQAGNEQKAQNAQQAAEQQRQQIREERVKQARVLQGAQNDGADTSSGSLGAIGALATNLSNNQGISLGAQQRSDSISDLRQGAADSMFASQQDSQEGQRDASYASVGTSIFGSLSKTTSGAKTINSIFS